MKLASGPDQTHPPPSFLVLVNPLAPVGPPAPADPYTPSFWWILELTLLGHQLPRSLVRSSIWPRPASIQTLRITNLVHIVTCSWGFLYHGGCNCPFLKKVPWWPPLLQPRWVAASFLPQHWSADTISPHQPSCPYRHSFCPLFPWAATSSSICSVL